MRSASTLAWACICSVMRSASARASSTTCSASSLAACTALLWAVIDSVSRSAAAAASANCWRTRSCRAAIILRTVGTTYRTTSATMTANPSNCPKKVDISLPCRGRGGDVDAEDPAGQGRRHGSDVGAQIEFHGVPLPFQLLGGPLHRRHHLLLGTGARVLNHLAAFGAGVVAQGRRLHARFLHDRFVIGLGGFELLGRLLVVGGGLGDHGVAFAQHLQDRRHHEGADDGEHDEEDGQHEEKCAVGDEEVAAPLASLCYHLASGKHHEVRVTHHSELRDGGCEDEQRHERQVDEVGRFNQTNSDEERREQPALRLRLPGNTRNQRVTGNTVTDTGSDCATTHDDSTADEGTGSDSGIHSFLLCLALSVGLSGCGCASHAAPPAPWPG